MTGETAGYEALVCELVAAIPRGCVATYGQIAFLTGHPRRSRMVGRAVSRVPADRRPGREPCRAHRSGLAGAARVARARRRPFQAERLCRPRPPSVGRVSAAGVTGGAENGPSACVHASLTGSSRFSICSSDSPFVSGIMVFAQISCRIIIAQKKANM